jgi:hypothetical protein
MANLLIDLPEADCWEVSWRSLPAVRSRKLYALSSPTYGHLSSGILAGLMAKVVVELRGARVKCSPIVKARRASTRYSKSGARLTHSNLLAVFPGRFAQHTAPGLAGLRIAFAKASDSPAVRINMERLSIVRSAAELDLGCFLARWTVWSTERSPGSLYGKYPYDLENRPHTIHLGACVFHVRHQLVVPKSSAFHKESIICGFAATTPSRVTSAGVLMNSSNRS